MLYGKSSAIGAAALVMSSQEGSSTAGCLPDQCNALSADSECYTLSAQSTIVLMKMGVVRMARFSAGSYAVHSYSYTKDHWLRGGGLGNTKQLQGDRRRVIVSVVQVGHKGLVLQGLTLNRVAAVDRLQRCSSSSNFDVLASRSPCNFFLASLELATAVVAIFPFLVCGNGLLLPAMCLLGGVDFAGCIWSKYFPTLEYRAAAYCFLHLDLCNLEASRSVELQLL